MPEPFKHMLNVSLIREMAGHFSRVWPEFESNIFVPMASDNLDALELKERSDQITTAMARCLPQDFERAADIIRTTLAPRRATQSVDPDIAEIGLTGWAHIPVSYYVGRHGLGHFEQSLELLKELSGGEFAIRFFLLEDPDRTLSIIKRWTRDPCPHVRGLVSEGTRPRLPWAIRLPVFVEDPTPLLPLLEALRDDEEEAIRRSVANNLNDISKDHPDLGANIAAQWLFGADTERQRLVRHACRTLVKQGHRGALKALGYRPPRVELVQLSVLTERVVFGSALEFEVLLASTSDRGPALIIDYAIHHRKANGGTSPKVFKWKKCTIAPRARIRALRKHSIRRITTRTYYPGTHHLEILVNGESLGMGDFELLM